MNVVEAAYRQSYLQPSAPALVHAELSLTYTQLRDAVEACAGHLLERGVRPVDVVGLGMTGRPLHLVVLLALARLGVTAVPLHPQRAIAQRKDLALRTGARWLVHGPEVDAAAVAALGLPAIAATADLIRPCAGAVLPAMDQRDTAFRIELSSGTTGTPKAMAHTHRTVVESVAKYCGLAPGGPGIRFMLYMDINTSVGLREALRQFNSGGCVVMPSDLRPGQFVDQVRRHQVNAVLMTPASALPLIHAIRDEPGRMPEQGPACPQIVYLALAGGAVAPAIQQQLRATISPALYIRYGTTEAGLLAISTPQTLALWPDSAGQVVPWIDAQVVDADDQPLPPDTQGRLRYRGSSLCAGYIGDPEATARAFRGEWYYPGDTGQITPAGMVYLGDREDDRLNLDGVKVSPLAVENVLLACAGIDEAAVYAVLNPANQRHVLLAAVVSRQAVNEGALHRKCVEAVGAPSTPAKFIRVNSLPRNAAGKLMRDELVKRTRLDPVPPRNGND